MKSINQKLILAANLLPHNAGAALKTINIAEALAAGVTKEQLLGLPKSRSAITLLMDDHPYNSEARGLTILHRPDGRTYNGVLIRS